MTKIASPHASSPFPNGEAMRDDEHYSFVGAWKYNGSEPPILIKEPLVYENVHMAVRSYK